MVHFPTRDVSWHWRVYGKSMMINVNPHFQWNKSHSTTIFLWFSFAFPMVFHRRVIKSRRVARPQRPRSVPRRPRIHAPSRSRRGLAASRWCSMVLFLNGISSKNDGFIMVYIWYIYIYMEMMEMMEIWWFYVCFEQKCCFSCDVTSRNGPFWMMVKHHV